MPRLFEVYTTRPDPIGRPVPNIRIAEYVEHEDGRVDFRHPRWDCFVEDIDLMPDLASELEQHRRRNRIILEQPA